MANSDDDIESEEYIRSSLCTRSPKPPSVVIHHDLQSDQMNNSPGQSTQQNQDQNYHQAPSQQVYTVNQTQNNQASSINHAVPNQIQQVKLPMSSDDNINSEGYIRSTLCTRSPKPSVVIHHGPQSDQMNNLPGQSTQQSQDQNYYQAPSQQVYTADHTQNNQANILNYVVPNQIQQVELPISFDDNIRSSLCTRSPKPSVVIHHRPQSGQMNNLPGQSTQQCQDHSQQVYAVDQFQNNQANMISQVEQNQNQQIIFPINSDYGQFNSSSNHVVVPPGTALLQQTNSNSSASNYHLQFDSYNLPSTSQQFIASDLSISDLYNQFDVDNLDEPIPPPTDYQQTKK